MARNPFILAAAVMAMAGIPSHYGIDPAFGPDRTAYYRARLARPSRYLNDAKHRKAVEGRRANLRRIRSERVKKEAGR